MARVQQRPLSDPRQQACGSPVGFGSRSDGGGLIIVGPTAGPLPELDALLGRAGIAPVEAVGERMANWDTVGAEVIEVGRQASRAIRNGDTAVVHLDSSTSGAAPIPSDAREFVCVRLGQILIGIADVPSYVVVHSERLTRALVIDSLGDDATEAIGTVADRYPVWQLSSRTMFPGTPVVMCPGDRDASALAEIFESVEATRK